TTGAITDERPLYPEEGEPLSPEERAIVDRLYRHHPEVEPTDNPYGGPFESGLHGHPLILGDSAVIL
ncbi:MAG: hypothetical protein GWN73_41180, partial [Actinobacteria bacterium]|nr:hypothetical protein [Actinomycetota bacterium]NIS36982.1 hypothetical protein [Actinomycetota bacterium]NIU71445.1 hypothetical protein [Actinomycetota bacterium]NIV90825.1 hypothetical protein [Actinomycetota bacterium]